MPRARPGARAGSPRRYRRPAGGAGWVVQDREDAVITAPPGVAVREFKLADGHGFADYLLFVGGRAVGEDVLADLQRTRGAKEGEA